MSSDPPWPSDRRGWPSLSFYHSHRDEIHRQMREEEEFIRRMRQSAPADKDADGNPVPS